jgi:hypothetical protein
MKHIMEKTILSLSIVAIMFVGVPTVSADSYGSTITSVIVEDHQTVDAGIAEMLPELTVTATSIFGLMTTSFLLKKTK